MHVVCFTREYKFTIHNQQNSKKATKNDNNRYCKKINDGRRRNRIHWHIFAHNYTSKLFFHVWIWFLGWKISLKIKWNIFKKLTSVKNPKWPPKSIKCLTTTRNYNKKIVLRFGIWFRRYGNTISLWINCLTQNTRHEKQLPSAIMSKDMPIYTVSAAIFDFVL